MTLNETPGTQPTRLVSIDALRGFVMLMMIFVNDLAGAGKIVPDWMVHFSDRHPRGSGMTFVDLVFPAFLFIVGISIPFALGGRIAKGQSLLRILGHVAVRTLSLLFVGILMVHETPDTTAMGWSGNWWCVLMYLSAILAFCSFLPPATASESGRKHRRTAGLWVRLAGLAALVGLAFTFRDAKGNGIITLAPFFVNTSWYGILGLIGWAYLVTALVYLTFRANRTAILGCMVLLMCVFAADKKGLFQGFWLSSIVGIGQTLGSLPAIAVCGLLLGSMLTATDRTSFKARTTFIFWLTAAFSAAALLLNRSYGISKNLATPSWCLWACAITASLWFGFYLISEVRPVKTISRPLELAGQNVLLAYLISEMLPGLLEALHLSDSYGQLAATLPFAIARSTCCAFVILLASTSLNRIGFRLKL